MPEPRIGNIFKSYTLGKIKIYQCINGASILNTIILIHFYTNRRGNFVSIISAQSGIFARFNKKPQIIWLGVMNIFFNKDELLDEV